MAYTYNPGNVGVDGIDKMRFELGDVMIIHDERSAALSDEEISAVLEKYPNNWKKAKLALLESILMRFSYEVDTTVGKLSLGLRDRYDAWKVMRDELKKEIEQSASVPLINSKAMSGHYFKNGMHDNVSAGSTPLNIKIKGRR